MFAKHTSNFTSNEDQRNASAFQKTNSAGDLLNPLTSPFKQIPKLKHKIPQLQKNRFALKSEFSPHAISKDPSVQQLSTYQKTESASLSSVRNRHLDRESNEFTYGLPGQTFSPSSRSGNYNLQPISTKNNTKKHQLQSIVNSYFDDNDEDR